LAALRLIGGKDVVEGPVLADKYDQMLDRRIGRHAMSGIVSIAVIIGGR
jgi:hypothetical protein